MNEKEDLRILIRYGFIGIFCFVINLLIMWIFVDFFKIPILVTTTLCFLILNIISHHLSRLFAFKNLNKVYKKTLIRFIFAMALSYVFNMTLMAIAVYFIKIHYLLASVCISILFFLVNFIIHRNWTFNASH